MSYSDAPCVGAKEIDTTPTQGVDKMTGASRKGADVQRVEHNALMADVLKPLTGMSPEQYRIYKHRFKLSPRDKAECTRLDTELPEFKQRAATAPASDKARKQFNDLNC